MVDSHDIDRLKLCGLATFHTVFLLIVLLIFLHILGLLGSALANLSTVVGLLLFVALWSSTWWATKNVLRDVKTPPVGEPPQPQSFVACGAARGAANGCRFFLVLFVVFAFSDLDLTRLDHLGIAVVSLLVGSLVGFVLALPIGAIIGGLFASLDVIAMKAAQRLCDLSTSEKERGSED
jgi:hypothetical protein